MRIVGTKDEETLRRTKAKPREPIACAEINMSIGARTSLGLDSLRETEACSILTISVDFADIIIADVNVVEELLYQAAI